MLRTFTAAEEVLRYLFNPDGSTRLIAEGWPENYRIVGAKYDPFKGYFEFAIDDMDGHNAPNWLEPRYTSIFGCDKCHEPFGKTLEEIAK